MSELLKIISFLLVSTLLMSGCGGGGSNISTPATAEHPSADEPPADEPPADEPPADEPPADEPPADEPPAPPIDLKIKNKAEAARFLTQTTFGPTETDINNLLQKGAYDKWIDDQFNLPPSFHLNRVKNLTRKMCADKWEDGTVAKDTWAAVYPRHQIWWETALNNSDQLRQRVAFALSEIMVVSDSSGLGLADSQYALTSYYDVLIKHALGNYRDLMEDVTLHPAMGIFLGMVRNQKADDELGIRPDENFARELLQLFTIGVNELNLDGTPKLDESGKTIPTYNQNTIQEFARVFTGWNYGDINWWEYFGESDRTIPMVAVEEYHDTEEKILLNGLITPSGNSAQQDLDAALDNIFSHPNIGPYIGKQLIQRLVKSNPSPAYVSRVATAFNDNGSGIRGDMKAVIKAILTDQEARVTTVNNIGEKSNSGKLKEPLLRISHLWRVFNIRPISRSGRYWEPEITCGQGNYDVYRFWYSLDNINDQIGQGPLQAKSVFNFFSPNYSPPGALNNKGIVAPEFEIITENSLVNSTNMLHYLIYDFSRDDNGVPFRAYSSLDFTKVTNLAQKTNDLLDYLSLTLLNNEMSAELRNILSRHLNSTNIFPDGREGQLTKAREAIALIIASPDFMIQK